MPKSLAQIQAQIAKLASSIVEFGWTQPILVDGANGIIAMEAVAHAPADGYTLLAASASNVAINPHLYKMPFDVEKAFAPVIQIANTTQVLVAHPSFPARSVEELIAMAKAKPNAIDYASAGNGSTPHLNMELLASMAGIKMNPIPYKAGPAAMTDLICGQVNMFSADFGVTVSQHKAGKIRGLAVTSTKRAAAVPDLPTVNEALGLKDYELIAYFAVFAPAGTPADVITRLNAAINAAANAKDLQDKFEAIGFSIDPGTPDALAKRNATESTKWEKAIRDAKIEPQ